MEFNWSTFVLEILNFLVLVWILKRFLYRPVLAVLENRRQRIEQSLQQAHDLNENATSLQQQYQHRLADWEQEKQQARESLQQEIQNERNKQLEQLQTQLSNEREKHRVIEQQQQQELIQQQQQLARAQGARFAASLLGAVASPELETRLCELLIQQLQNLDTEQREHLLQACQSVAQKIEVNSAFPLGEPQRQQLQQALQPFCNQAPTLEFKQLPELLAGLRIVIGGRVLALNLADELQDFATLSDGQHFK